ncbi:MAG: universal stress protein [Pseudomonadota bacterium]|nr:universal stress protein [Pseudomonadota bacterium]
MTLSAPLRVVATLALDDRDAAVLGAVDALSARRPCEVTLLHVLPRASATAAAAVDACVARLGVPAAARVVVGAIDEVAPAVLAEVDAGLLIVGRSVTVDGAPAWGPHGRALLRSAGCPVLIVPLGASLGFGRAAVGMDLSPSALETLAFVRGLYDEVVAVAALAPDDAPADPEAAVEAIEAHFRSVLAERDLPVPRLIARAGGSPADVLLGVAAEFDLLAVGSRGLTALAAVFLGSTAERLAGRSPRPVLVVRRRGEARGLLGALFRP